MKDQIMEGTKGEMKRKEARQRLLVSGIVKTVQIPSKVLSQISKTILSTVVATRNRVNRLNKCLNNRLRQCQVIGEEGKGKGGRGGR